ncbi:IclR family transcriptional regulator C-terminal domain-containing protein [Paenarthrobacter sp. A20]|uniref:IclR family transcriptional regulator domain-containing protein n=1 Tax=Paenarthrobacter sp. A20 TaxID=2817891 RepID=UPI0020A0190F|nr:IclR family transcriptional regulator C-terminal domain-containing protein [Paenarthrobacter sp. A20]MCP1415580.1 IclR family pca regulon transcriptional regulator [Paenarthrobacter sp. A20]
MAQRGIGPDFIEALARGLDVLKCFSPDQPRMSLSQVAQAADLTRPTARRILLTLEELGYVRADNGVFGLMPKVLELGMAYIGAQGLWEMARPHLEDLVRRTGESSSMAQLDGSDIIYVARVAVPKLIALRVDIGTRFPALRTSQGKILLASLPEAEALEALAQPSRSGLPGDGALDRDAVLGLLSEVRTRGWALADEELAPGVRSISVGVRDGSNVVRASMNVTVHAQETSVEKLTGEYLPMLQDAAAAAGLDWARWQARPVKSLGR